MTTETWNNTPDDVKLNYRVQLGDRVRDVASGFEGIATQRIIHMHGCDHVAVCPPAKDKREFPETVSFDEQRLEILERGGVPLAPGVFKENTKPGGPVRKPLRHG